uniref:Uncharacterized protein n=1 Tax=Plectus sambesii TaxID=2011161 RepID=A0A914VZQ0_9BILA
MSLQSRIRRILISKRRLLQFIVFCCLALIVVGWIYSQYFRPAQEYVPQVVQNIWLPKKRACQCKKLRPNPAESVNARPYCYENPLDDTVVGKQFKCTSRQYLEKLNLHEIHPLTSLVPAAQEVTFATAAKPDDLMNLRALIASIQKFYPNSALIIYDLGEETETRAKRLRFALKNVSGVQVKDSYKERFPPWTKDTDALTPILMADAIRHYGRVVWLRPQMTVASSILRKAILTSCPNGSQTSCDRAKNNIILLGSGRQFEEPVELGFIAHFPVTSDIKRNLRYHNSSAIYVERHPQSYELIRWLILCGLDPSCWSCKSRRGENLDCLPYILPLLLYHRLGNNEEFTLALTGAVVEQPPRPSECHFWCQTLSIDSWNMTARMTEFEHKKEKAQKTFSRDVLHYLYWLDVEPTEEGTEQTISVHKRKIGKTLLNN